MKKRILVIDDEEIITISLQKLLRHAGYDVVIVQDADSALQKVKEDDFDLIISDVRMPDIDGIQAIKQIRNYLQEAEKDLIPEILITGYADLDKYEEAKKLNVKKYVNKPFDNTEFLQGVKDILN